MTTLSQPQKAMMSTGVPDILARHKTRGIVLWLESKRPTDPEEWKPSQIQFMRDCTEKETYVVGSEGNLRVALHKLGFELPPLYT